MKNKIAFAILMSLLPATLLAQPHVSTARVRQQSYHDRGPKLHDRSVHSRF